MSTTPYKVGKNGKWECMIIDGKYVADGETDNSLLHQAMGCKRRYFYDSAEKAAEYFERLRREPCEFIELTLNGKLHALGRLPLSLQQIRDWDLDIDNVRAILLDSGEVIYRDEVDELRHTALDESIVELKVTFVHPDGERVSVNVGPDSAATFFSDSIWWRAETEPRVAAQVGEPVYIGKNAFGEFVANDGYRVGEDNWAIAIRPEPISLQE